MKLKQLLKRLTDKDGEEASISIVKDNIRKYEDLQLREVASDMEAVKNLLTEFKDKVKKIDKDIISLKSDELPDMKRDLLIDKKETYLEVIIHFKVDDEMKQLDSWADEQLEELIKQGY